MSASNTTPCGVKSLVECMCRAVLFAQPVDIPEFLSRYLEKMTHGRDDESRDPKKVAFDHEEQWEKTFFKEEYKRMKTPKQSAEESPSTTSSVSSTFHASFMVSARHEVRPKTQRVSSVMVPHRQESVGLTAEKKQRLVPPLPALVRRAKTRRVLPFKVPCQTDTKPSFPPTLPVLPPIKQKAPPRISKQEQGHKSTKGRGSGGYTCHLIDCPFHKKPKKGSAAITELGPVRTSKVPTVKGDLAEVHVPYRPKGGLIVDPELVPKRTKRGAGTDRTTGAERTLLYGGQSGGSSKGGANSTDLPHGPHGAHTVHTIRYRRMRVQCSEL